MNTLANLKQFQHILESYQVSAANKKILKQIRLAVLVGPTSSGRNTVIQQLLRTGEYHFIVSDTTRAPRQNNGAVETNGKEYWFRTEDQVLADLQAGNYLEAEIIHNQQVSGISLRELKLAQNEQKIAISDMDIGGVHTILAAKPDAVAILLLPPSFEEWQRRIQNRGKMSPTELNRRMQTACSIFGRAIESQEYVFVINDNIEHAMEQIHQAVYYNRIDATAQDYGRQLAERLYVGTMGFIENNL